MCSCFKISCQSKAFLKWNLKTNCGSCYMRTPPLEGSKHRRHFLPDEIAFSATQACIYCNRENPLNTQSITDWELRTQMSLQEKNNKQQKHNKHRRQTVKSVTQCQLHSGVFYCRAVVLDFHHSCFCSCRRAVLSVTVGARKSHPCVSSVCCLLLHRVSSSPRLHGFHIWWMVVSFCGCGDQ